VVVSVIAYIFATAPFYEGKSSIILDLMFRGVVDISCCGIIVVNC
jgi:hypothetical protein